MNFKQEALLNWFIKDHGGEQGSTRFQGSEIQGSETSEIAEDLTASLLEYIKTTSEGGGGDHTKYRSFLMRLTHFFANLSQYMTTDLFSWILPLFNQIYINSLLSSYLEKSAQIQMNAYSTLFRNFKFEQI